MLLLFFTPKSIKRFHFFWRFLYTEEKGGITMTEHTILIVDDEPEIASLLERVLHKEGMPHTVTASSVAEGYTQFKQAGPSLMLLDIMLPDGEGYELCKKVREESNIPILFMSAKDEEVDKLLGLAIGGDDYITKPFSPKEVAYRVKAHLRRLGYREQEPQVIQVGPFTMDAAEMSVTKNNRALDLTAKEMGLMALFMHHPNQILSKETLFERVWGENFFGSDNTMMVHIRRLREKIEDEPSKPQHIITVKGLGYKFVQGS